MRCTRGLSIYTLNLYQLKDQVFVGVDVLCDGAHWGHTVVAFMQRAQELKDKHYVLNLDDVYCIKAYFCERAHPVLCIPAILHDCRGLPLLARFHYNQH